MRHRNGGIAERKEGEAMTEQEVKLVVGGLLHDIGKIIYRQDSTRKAHSVSGCDFLQEEAEIQDREVLDSVLYHHAKFLREGKLPENSNAYIVYIADNIAAATDRRRQNTGKDTQKRGFQMSVPLQSIFNLLNGNSQNYYYKPQTLEKTDKINYPQEEQIPFDRPFYEKIKQGLLENLKSFQWDEAHINSLLELMEYYLTYIPSSTNQVEVGDISLFDHVKLTAAVCSCINRDLLERGVKNYRKELFDNAGRYYQKKIFLLYSMDLSGIQDFIYTITSKNALKMLRAKSFYLEFLMEHIIDELLERLELSRANLIYRGGGHCYLLLPNNEKCKKILGEQEDIVNKWLTKEFQTALYIAGGMAEASAENLRNKPEGSYTQLYHSISEMISAKKFSRYRAEEIRSLNRHREENYTRECKVCKRLDKLNESGLCSMCTAIQELSGGILKGDFFTVMRGKKEQFLPLPGEKYLEVLSEEELQNRMAAEDSGYVRAYRKKHFYVGRHIGAKMWVADYAAGGTFQELAQKAEGTERLAVYRADVDNLGQAFVSGFLRSDEKEAYVTLSRTAALSRQLSMFFKHYINVILENPGYRMGKKEGRRNITVVYSGGDDLFLVGAWDEVIEFSIDLQEAFQQYTQGTLTLSGGIGLYYPTYPVHIMARETQDLEEAAKSLEGKNAVAVFEKDGTYHWDRMKKGVLEEKLGVLSGAFGEGNAYGKACLYQILELIRRKEEKISFARYVYLLARMEPDSTASEEEEKAYRIFSKKMYNWMKNGSEEDRRELITAIHIYMYKIREREDSSRGGE